MRRKFREGGGVTEWGCRCERRRRYGSYGRLCFLLDKLSIHTVCELTAPSVAWLSQVVVTSLGPSAPCVASKPRPGCMHDAQCASNAAAAKEAHAATPQERAALSTSKQQAYVSPSAKNHALAGHELYDAKGLMSLGYQLLRTAWHLFASFWASAGRCSDPALRQH
eukprot:6207277-Pleurochrysis_carterae.AAC.1